MMMMSIQLAGLPDQRSEHFAWFAEGPIVDGREGKQRRFEEWLNEGQKPEDGSSGK
jgi:hypothetical protein